MTEKRVVNEKTGGEKGQKLARFDLLPPDALRQVAEHYGKGAEKYDDRNWERGYDWSLSFGAMMRHAWAYWGGEDIDPETGSHHLAAVVFHAFALLTFAEHHPDLDDRSDFGGWPDPALVQPWLVRKDAPELTRVWRDGRWEYSGGTPLLPNAGIPTEPGHNTYTHPSYSPEQEPSL